MVFSQLCLVCFFFQAEDGIRYPVVTGVQTCALPICFVQRELYLRPDGMLFPHISYLFHNNGNETFTNVWTEDKKASMGVALADYDNDGWVDFIVSNWNGNFQLFHNWGSEILHRHWLTVRLRGGGPIDRDAVGTKVYVTD